MAEGLSRHDRLLGLFRADSEQHARERLQPFVDLAIARLSEGDGRALPPMVPIEEIRKHFEGELPTEGEEIAAVLEDVRLNVFPHGRNKRATTFFAHMDVPPSDYSIYMGLVIRALAQDPISFSSSRSGTFVELQLLRWLATLAFADVTTASGVVTSGGSQANLHALLLYRNKGFADHGIDVSEVGLRDAFAQIPSARFVVLSSRAAHQSVQSSMRFIGLGSRTLREIEVDHQQRMDVRCLERELKACRTEGIRPLAIIATGGTTGCGSIDPIRAITDLAREYGVPVHADLAHGGMFLFSSLRDRLDGIEGVDSITFDPHKILGINSPIGTLLVRNREMLDWLGKVPLTYYPSERVPDLGEQTIDGSRALNSLGAWLMLRVVGRNGFHAIVDHFVALTMRFVGALRQTGAFDLLSDPPDMNIVAYRLRPVSNDLEAENERNLEILRRMHADGDFALSWLKHDSGVLYLRSVFVNPATSLEEVERFAQSLARLAGQA